MSIQQIYNEIEVVKEEIRMSDRSTPSLADVNNLLWLIEELANELVLVSRELEDLKEATIEPFIK